MKSEYEDQALDVVSRAFAYRDPFISYLKAPAPVVKEWEKIFQKITKEAESQ